MAGYAFAKIDFPGRRALFVATLAGLMVPKEAMFIPLFLMILRRPPAEHATQALILPRLAAPLGVFIMTQFFSKVPAEVEEAARIDGAGPWRIFYTIMLPLARPAMASLAIFTFVLTWNDYLWPLVASTRDRLVHRHHRTGLAAIQLRRHHQPRRLDGPGAHRQPAADRRLPDLPTPADPRHHPGQRREVARPLKASVLSRLPSTCPPIEGEQTVPYSPRKRTHRRRLRRRWPRARSSAPAPEPARQLAPPPTPAAAPAAASLPASGPSALKPTPSARSPTPSSKGTTIQLARFFGDCSTDRRQQHRPEQGRR